MFGSRVGLKHLAILCRSLSTSLHAGVPILKAFDVAGRKSSDPRIRTVMADVILRLKGGDDVSSALRAHEGRFPDLMVDMIHVAEQTGTLPEVLHSLADHYENNLRLRKDFLGQITLPVVQLVAAIFIIAGLILLLGMIGSRPGSEPLDVLGWGLLGPKGAMVWLSGWAIAVASAFIGYRLAAASLTGQQMVHRVLMNIPVVGGCMQSFAVARFSWAFALTQEAGMPVDDALEGSLRATANGVFIAAKTQIVGDVMSGESLTDAMQNSGLFPDEFIQIVDVAETSGTVPEQLHRLSPQFEEQARRSLRGLAMALGWLVWLMVAGFIIFVIFSIVLWYVGLINSAVDDALNPM